ncbi:hypothetical protein [Jeotgalibaca porci]|uniref:hypothetical protein n=1 Tax=Jeotgalibaca porci TaxID=1868793 RepID=UPI0035A11CDA
MKKNKKVILTIISFVFIYLANLGIDLMGNDFNWDLLINSFVKTTIMCGIFYMGVIFIKK